MERMKMNFELGEQEHKRFIKTLERENVLLYQTVCCGMLEDIKDFLIVIKLY